jgi:hypothetical protein
MRPILKVFEFYGLVNYIIREELPDYKTETCHLCDPSTRAAGLLIGKEQRDGIIIDVFGTIRKKH